MYKNYVVGVVGKRESSHFVKVTLMTLVIFTHTGMIQYVQCTKFHALHSS